MTTARRVDRRFLVRASLCICVLVSGWARASAKVYIDIDSPGFRRLPLALVSVPSGSGTASCPAGNIPEGIKEVLLQDLDVSGYFRILSEELFLVPAEAVKLYPEKIDFRAWRLIGAEALILVRATCREGGVEMDGQLLDVLTEKLITWKRYKGQPSEYRRMAHRFANEVTGKLTGLPGAFDSRIAYISNATGSKELWVMDYDGNAPRRLTSLESICLSPEWSRDGKKIVFTSFRHEHPGLYLLEVGREGSIKRLLAGFSPLCSGAAWSPTGAWMAFSASLEGNTELFRVDLRAGSKPERLTKSWSIDVSPSWAPDGKRLVFVSDRAGHPDLYLFWLEGGKVRRLTFQGSYNADPHWSPRGDTIVFASRVDSFFQIFRIRANGTDRVQLTEGMGDHLHPSWSPDGRLIVFSSNREGSFDLYLIRADGTGLRRLTWTPEDETDPAWSPRGGP